MRETQQMAIFQQPVNIEMEWGKGEAQTKEPIISDGLLVPAFA